MRLVHLTDPHLSSLERHRLWRLAGKRRLGYLSWQRRRRHLHRRDMLAHLCAAVRSEQPDVLALTGDLVQLGLPEELDEAQRWLEDFAGTPLLLVPGNHDVYQPDSAAPMHAAWAPYLHLGTGDEAAFPSRLACGELVLIGLSSASAQPFWSAGGCIGAAQLARLDAALADARGALRCVLVHHPPVPDRCSARKALRDAAALARLLDRHAVELVVHGHVHRNQVYTLDGGTRVFGTASASNVAPQARASYRVFDVAAARGGWQLEMRLMTLDAAGTARPAGHARWLHPAPPQHALTEALHK